MRRAAGRGRGEGGGREGGNWAMKREASDEAVWLAEQRCEVSRQILLRTKCV